MSTTVLICDDSSFARKQVKRALPPGWQVDISFAGNGREALSAIEAGKGNILFLDLTMPEMDGFETLEQIKSRDLPTLVIVISGDIQPEAMARVKKLGALDFIKKPVDAKRLEQVLTDFGLYSG
ncbi:response regulator [Marinimicrobium alkaliphilum]|uniref:response regulator n=1 Tax=Marinimicrobium alkaliphilum TaxID=2202654 RepID=UPI0018E0BA30|nr:response regulator [Marinimicrobium alkaliphilum]